MEKENKLEKLKEEYSKLQKKYDLPPFENLNEDFNIEKAAEVETEYIIREVRKFLVDKFSNYMRFIENLLNPVNVPMFVFSTVKAMTIEDRKKLAEIYKKMAKVEIDLVEVDISFSEEKEAKFIKDAYRVWQEVKEGITDTLISIKKNWDSKFETNNKGYFG